MESIKSQVERAEGQFRLSSLPRGPACAVNELCRVCTPAPFKVEPKSGDSQRGGWVGWEGGGFCSADRAGRNKIALAKSHPCQGGAAASRAALGSGALL